MKLMIASDLHGSAAYTRRLLELYRDTGCQRLVLLGDLLYHGPRNPLPEGYEPPAVAKLLNDMADELLCVRGNCDAEVDQMVLHFPILSDSALLVLDGLTIHATHGHIHGPDKMCIRDSLGAVPVLHLCRDHHQAALMEGNSGLALLLIPDVYKRQT